MSRVVLELRGLEPPEPMMRILQALGEGAGVLEAHLPHEPVPLYSMLDERGYDHAVERLEPGHCVLVIRRRP